MMITHSADQNRIYYIEEWRKIKEEFIQLLLTEPYSFKDEYGCIIFKGFLLINGENVPFVIDTNFKNIRLLSPSKNAVFLFENKEEIITSFMHCFKKFYRNRVNSIYQKNGKNKGKLLKTQY